MVRGASGGVPTRGTSARRAGGAVLVLIALLWLPWLFFAIPGDDAPTLPPRKPTTAVTNVESSPSFDGARNGAVIAEATNDDGTAAETTTATVERYPITSERFANGAANRSPHRRRRPLFAASEADVAAGKAKVYLPQDAAARRSPPNLGAGTYAPADARCWDRVGEPVGIPKWAVALFGTIPSAAHYHVLANETDSDPWGVLIAWVPSKFMPPQKDGKNAAGQLIKPPTRGRDPGFYLNEYNATWHAAAEAGGLDYHFQLMHRNSIAVCIRERLHITALRCTPHISLAPMLVHHCLCRHCSEPSNHPFPKPTTRIPGYSSTFLFQALYSIPRAVVDRTPFLQRRPRLIKSLPKDTPARPRYSGQCVQAASAPWLVSNDTVTAFKYEGLQNDLAALLAAQADESGVVMLTIFNEFWIDHLHNFYFSMVSRASLTNMIIATMDEDSLRVCVANRLPCWDATAIAEMEADMVSGGAGRKAGSTRKVTEAMSWIKPRLALAVIELGFGFFMVDLDLSWNAWPMKDVLEPGTDLTHQCDAEMRTSINSGFYLSRPTARSWLYFANMMTFRPPENSDQTAMKLFVRYDHTHGLSNTCLDKWQFNMKCNYKRANSVKRVNGVESFEWIAFDRNRTKFFWKILHATCMSGALKKLLYLRTMNSWFLDDLDAITAKPYCVLLTDGSTRDGVARTRHSLTYTTATDDSFLKSRH